MMQLIGNLLCAFRRCTGVYGKRTAVGIGAGKAVHRVNRAHFLADALEQPRRHAAAKQIVHDAERVQIILVLLHTWECQTHMNLLDVLLPRQNTRRRAFYRSGNMRFSLSMPPA